MTYERPVIETITLDMLEEYIALAGTQLCFKTY